MGDMEVMVDTDMVDTVAREKPKLIQKPGTVTSVTDTVPDTVFLDTDLDTDMEVTDVAMPVMEVTVLDTAMVDTVVDMAVMVDTDTESKYFPPNSPKKPFY